jgi:hypothetical protein
MFSTVRAIYGKPPVGGRAMRLVLLAVVSVAATMGLRPAAADTFGGWRYTAPKGYTVDARADHVAFTKVKAPTFCSVALFPARIADDATVKEQAREWQTVVEQNFAATGAHRVAATRTKHGFGVQPTLAAIRDGDGNAFTAQHYSITPPGMIARVLVTSSTPASLAKCAPVAKAFLDSLAIDAAGTVATDPEARAETPVGRWAVAGASDAGDVAREYTFAADGTYAFRSETTGGKLEPAQWRDVDEAGTFTVVGTQLTLAPATATSTLFDDAGAKRATKVRLEKTTYTWSKQYVQGANSWTLVLAPAKKTARDGELFDDRYRYSDAVQPAWRQLPPPPADDDAAAAP